MNELRKEYLEKFGEHSLDRVIISEPFDVETGNRKLRRAIDTNTPLPQIDKEIWDELVF